MNAIAQAPAASSSGSKLDNRRMLAALIDLAVVGAGGAAILATAGVLGGDGAQVGAPLAAVVAGWALYYWFACESGGGQTLGKKAMKLRVVMPGARTPGMREIALRTALRPIDTALVGLIAMIATGERRARLGDLVAGTTIVSTDAPAKSARTEPASVAAATVPAATPAVAEAALPAPEPESVAVAEPVVEVAEPAVEPAERVVEVTEPPVELAAAPPAELPDEAPAEAPRAASDHVFDIATPSLKELARDVASAAGTAPAEGAPRVQVEVAGAEVDAARPDADADADEADMAVRPVETVSAIDLVMGADEASEDAPASDGPLPGDRVD